MTYYFQLQFRRLERSLRDAGMHPALGMMLIAAAFAAGLQYLFLRTAYANWITALIAFSILLNLGEGRRTDLLKALFSKGRYYLIRLLENVLAAVPFLFFLLYKREFPAALVLFLFALATVLISFRQRGSIAIPTPFRRFPFEFIAGFRKSLWLIALSAFLLFKSVQIHHFNLGLSALALLFLLAMSYYFKPEQKDFVWMYATDSAGFLKKKVATALICMSILSLPFFVVLCMVYPESTLILVGVQGLGYLFLVSMIYAKYASFPQEMSLPQAVLYGLSLWFPPMLLVVIPIFYIQAKRRLKPILE